jgi:hypothetical protein
MIVSPKRARSLACHGLFGLTIISHQTAAGGPGAGLLGFAWTTAHGPAHHRHHRPKPQQADGEQHKAGPEPEAPPEAQ